MIGTLAFTSKPSCFSQIGAGGKLSAAGVLLTAAAAAGLRGMGCCFANRAAIWSARSWSTAEDDPPPPPPLGLLVPSHLAAQGFADCCCCCCEWSTCTHGQPEYMCTVQQSVCIFTETGPAYTVSRCMERCVVQQLSGYSAITSV